MWAVERPDGGRGFGFTGGHFHLNWGNDNQRKVVLNAILWLAKVEIPVNGVESKVTVEQIAANLDPKKDSDKVSNVAGNWNVEVQVNGNAGTPKIQLVQAGNNLLGHYDGLLGQRELNGQVRGKEVNFSITGEMQGNKVTARYAGKLNDDSTLVGTIKFDGGDGAVEATWKGKRVK